MNPLFNALRNEIVASVKAEMVGPGSEADYISPPEQEIISENPMQRYSLGILYPQKLEILQEEDDSFGNSAAESEENEFLDVGTTIANQYYPSSLGLSFYVTGINPELKVRVLAARYRKLELSECEVSVDTLPDTLTGKSLFVEYLTYGEDKLRIKNKIDKKIRNLLQEMYDHEGYKNALWRLYTLQNNGWIRVPLPEEQASVTIPTVESETVTWHTTHICENLKLTCIRRPNALGNYTLFTVSLINEMKAEREKKDQDAFYQAGLTVVVADEQNVFIDYRSNNKHNEDPEEKSLALLYRSKTTYAVGHGCAVSWEIRDGKPCLIKTEIIPSVEVPQLKFDVDELAGHNEILLMRCLSDWSDMGKAELVGKLNGFVNVYNQWINGLEVVKSGLASEYHDAAQKHIEKCREAYARMCRGIKMLEQNDDDCYLKAFRLANRAMLMQRAHTILQQKKRFAEDEPIAWPDYRTFPDKDACWRPFQLAFILMNLEGVSRPESNDRDIVDLIWFPTGGGKTEAYLGVSAYTIFLRRIKYPERGLGTAIIMRYTLRLLTAQQFQRASTLICACEQIRKDNEQELGNERISIGLWIGSASTPNILDDALKQLDNLIAGRDEKNPFQVLVCPWCGTRLVKEKGRGQWGYRSGNRPKKFIIHCPESSCAFHEEHPIVIIDEDIYKTPPTLLFGTVDKFALMPWKREVSNIFALNEANECLSPELIIQDELHLISGPLGTMVGIYETAIDALCSAKGIRPKIIASTATIRRAGDQVKALYDRDVSQFPPPGIDAEDSFFARQADLTEKPGRLYVGIMATGKTMTTTQIRVMSAILQYIQEMDYTDEIKDKYWTLVGYFNTIRELGKCSTFVEDDIKDQVRRIAVRRRAPFRMFYEAEELTSRKTAGEIPSILERLQIPHPEKGNIPILLASNMISVGVDVDRLGVMTVVSQPKTTSEYIQATSRVGRKYPGLVFTLYDGARPRDRSHYERFTAYHESFYKYVEPTSVTPFSGPARDRALHAVLVTLVRHLLGLVKDTDAGSFSSNVEKLNQIRKLMLDRVSHIMPEELSDAERDINAYIDFWEDLANVKKDELHYMNPQKEHLLYPAGKKDKHWSTMQSMRNVDVDCNIFVKD